MILIFIPTSTLSFCKLGELLIKQSAQETSRRDPKHILDRTRVFRNSSVAGSLSGILPAAKL